MESLSQSESEVLEKLVKIGKGNIDEISVKTGIPKSTLASIAQLLKDKGLVKLSRKTRTIYKITDEGLKAINRFPEEELYDLLVANNGSIEISRVKEIMGEDRATIAINWALKRGIVSIAKGVVRLTNREKVNELKLYRDALLKIRDGDQATNIDQNIIKELLKRRMIEKRVVDEIIIEVSEKAKEMISVATRHISRINTDVIVNKLWKKYRIKPYDVTAEPPFKYPAFKHFYVEFLEMLKDIMISLGFEEISGEIVIPELWNFDVLFQPQDHPAREIHDNLLADADKLPKQMYMDLLKKTSEIHRKYWRYRFSEDQAMRLVFRSQTTAITIKYIHERKEPPVRGFIIGRVFRRDDISATRLPEFHQLDGVIMEKDMNFRKLLGVLKQIANSLGFKEIKFKPAYFPFTEPSVEGYVRIGELGYVEIFGAGLFRPGVLELAGVKYNVGAWGMGVDRMAMAYLGLNDIRSLYSYDLKPGSRGVAFARS